MEGNILEKIIEDLSLEDLSTITKTVLATIYRKLGTELNFTGDMHCSVVSIGPEEYEVELVITNDSHFGDGEQYISTYWI